MTNSSTHPKISGFPSPEFQALNGRFVKLQRLDWASHGDGLFECLGGEANADIWRWLGDSGPYQSDERHQFESEFTSAQTSELVPWQTVIIRDAIATQGHGKASDQKLGQVLGMASYMRIRPSSGSMEVGFIAFSHALQRTPHATEAMYLMMKYCFEGLGYRRYEWKCNDKNRPSIKAAKRLGFTYEGTHRQDQIAKGQNRDTAWFSIIDGEWPIVRSAFEQWLSPDNFDEDGQQRARLEDLRYKLQAEQTA